MKKIKVILTLVVTAALMSGCATIVSQSSNWPVAIQSNPTAAAFAITNQSGKEIITGTTPSNVRLASGVGYFDNEEYTLKFTKDGFQEKTVALDTSLNGWYFGNLAFGGIIGMLIIDPATGAMFKLPETLSTDLTTEISKKPLSVTGPKIN